MQTLVIDDNGIVKKLEQRGFSRTQAEGIVEALGAVDVSLLATKADLAALEVCLYKFLFAAMSAQTALIVGLLQLPK